MTFDASRYGPDVQAVLAIHGAGERPMALANGEPVQAGIEALSGRTARELFPAGRSPDGALSGLYLYFCGYEQSHNISQELHTTEGSFWHGIMHRQEPDAANAAYWFRRVGQHPVFPGLHRAAEDLGLHVGDNWDPFAFIEICEKARRKPGTEEEAMAKRVQLAEWQLLFDYCAGPVR
jgi:hypothetical protein